jgi:EAL domain-containing protein (putative c-di-GMP-specific phosphodiesterase class I)
MQSIYQHRHLIVQEIKRALDNNQFEAFYQPQFDINTGRIVGLEALIRWNHPEKGLINPDIFIAIAEEMGMISEIGLFMLETGCRQIQSWVKQHIQPVKLSINVSAFQLVDSNFDVMLCDMIKQYELPQDLLTVEITETLLMQDMDKVLPRLKHLSECGIGICIDDFGVGYSSLSYLQTLPVDILKIDRSFLAYISSDTKQSSIINAIVAMARELGIQVIVEGVETRLQLDYIKNIGCTTAQGYLLSHPIPETEVTQLLKQNDLKQPAMDELPGITIQP